MAKPVKTDINLDRKELAQLTRQLTLFLRNAGAIITGERIIDPDKRPIVDMATQKLNAMIPEAFETLSDYDRRVILQDLFAARYLPEPPETYAPYVALLLGSEPMPPLWDAKTPELVTRLVDAFNTVSRDFGGNDARLQKGYRRLNFLNAFLPEIYNGFCDVFNTKSLLKPCPKPTLFKISKEHYKAESDDDLYPAAVYSETQISTRHPIYNTAPRYLFKTAVIAFNTHPDCKNNADIKRIAEIAVHEMVHHFAASLRSTSEENLNNNDLVRMARVTREQIGQYRLITDTFGKPAYYALLEERMAFALQENFMAALTYPEHHTTCLSDTIMLVNLNRIEQANTPQIDKLKQVCQRRLSA